MLLVMNRKVRICHDEQMAYRPFVNQGCRRMALHAMKIFINRFYSVSAKRNKPIYLVSAKRNKPFYSLLPNKQCRFYFCSIK